VFTLVESSTFYGAVAKGAAAGNLLVKDVTTGSIDDHQLIYDLEGEPASQLAEQWPSLPDATKTTSAAGEQLLTTIRDRLENQGYSTFAGGQETKTCLYDKQGEPLQTESRLDTRLENADDKMWLVPGIALRESKEASNRDDQLPGTPTKEQLGCYHCDNETDHRFDSHEALPDDTWSGQAIWECRACGACRYGPNPSTHCPS